MAKQLSIAIQITKLNGYATKSWTIEKGSRNKEENISIEGCLKTRYSQF